MSIMTALYTGVSGLSSNGTALSVIGDNIANTNTVGYKASKAVFGDVLSQALGGSSSQIGRGTYLQAVMPLTTQGTLESTSNPLDMAIDGDGYFIVKDSAGTTYYTRAGEFKLDDAGNIVNPEGYELQGYLTQEGGQLGTINVSAVNSPPKTSSSADIAVNLDASTEAKDPSAAFEIDSSNNSIKFTLGGISTTVYTATIASGKYTGDELATQVELSLEAALAGVVNDAFSVDFDSTSPNKFTITNSSGNTVNFLWGDLGTTAEVALGFSGTTDDVNSSQTTSASLTTFPLDLTGTDAIRIQIGAGSGTATIGAGPYANGAALATALETALNSALDTITGTPGHTGADGLDVTFTSDNQLIITNNFGGNVNLLWDDPLTTAESALGFSAKPGTETIVDSTAGTVITTGDSDVYGNSTIFTIDSSNNSLVFNNGTDRTAYITPGSYTANGLSAAIKTALEQYDGSATDTYTVTYDTTTKQFTIINGDSTATNSVPVTLKWSNASTTAEQILGYSSLSDSTLSVNTNAAGASPSTGSYATSTYAAVGFDPADPADTSDFPPQSVTFYDSLGNSRMVTIYYTKTAENTTITNGDTGSRWHWYAVISSEDSKTDQVQVGAQGYLEFDTSGRLVADIQEFNSFNFNGTVDPNQAISFDYGQSLIQNGSGLAGTTQFGSPDSVLTQTQDGYAAGSLMNLVIDQDGVMTGVFTNGQTQEITSIAIAKFTAPTELTKMGRNLFAESSGSGQPIIGTAGASGRGTIMANSLEMSNVDLAEEFVRMIAAQRGFQANTKVISTTDDMLTELMNLKR
ncbi:MAG: flagellar hook-basal body complex protein [Alphaproteobacteria bacterium]|uniref:Flagellar hook protein FlgE n=1 Tax=Candidatus Nitrobium versatile TaxID=2884831 RepID=A0A953J4Y0_9BACT|nr:flagellar hook-basal body complex protein [Candidatus Nitrobium versatile]